MLVIQKIFSHSAVEMVYAPNTPLFGSSLKAAMLLKLFQNQNKKLKIISYYSRGIIRPKQKTFHSCLRKAFLYFANVTKINGFYYLRESITSGLSRYLIKLKFWSENYLFFFWQLNQRSKTNFFVESNFSWIWTITPIFLLIFAGILISLLTKNFNQKKVYFTRTNPAFAFVVPFPAITICTIRNSYSQHVDEFFQNV